MEISFEMIVTRPSKLLKSFLQILLCQLLVLLPSVVFSCDQDSKSSYFLPKPFHFMKGSAITTTSVLDVFSCQLLCLHEPGCISLNFGRNQDAEGRHICGIFDKPSYVVIQSDQFDFYTRNRKYIFS